VHLIEPALLHVLGPKALHHRVEIFDVEVATVGKLAAPVALSA
jgi:hypothetical protein